MFGEGGRQLGIDLGDKAVKMVQLRRSGQKALINAWGMVERDLPNFKGGKWRTDMFEDIKLALQVNGIKGGRAYVALPDSLLNISYRKVPPMPKEELVNALKWEVGKDTRFSVEEMLIDTISLGQVTEGADTMDAYLVAVTKRDIVEELCRKLSGVKISVRSVEFSTLAQLSCLFKVLDASGSTAMVDLGEQQTSLIVLKDGQVRFFRMIDAGGRHITDAISQATGLNWWEANKLKETGLRSTSGGDEELSRALRGSLESIVDEVFQTFHFYSAERREGGVERVVITGGGALMPGISGFIQDILGIPTDVIDPFGVCSPSHSLRERDRLMTRGARMATALGLAMME